MTPPSHSILAPPQTPRRVRVAIVGGGISGLAAAQWLIERAPHLDVTLLEASERLGGILQTTQREGWLIEHAADMFTTRDPWAVDLCRRLGLADDLLGTDPAYRQAYVVRRGRLCPVPAGFTLLAPARLWPILATPILSPWGKLRLAAEWFIPPRRTSEDESLASFVVRRFGREAFDRLIQPLIGGIYTADPAQLSMQATLPQFLELEQRYGSLIRAAWQGEVARPGSALAAPGTAKPMDTSASGARYGLFVAPRYGMQQLVDALAARLPPHSVRLATPVQHIAGGPPWRLTLASGEQAAFDALIVATPAPIAGQLLKDVDRELAALLGSIAHAGCAVVVLGLDREQLKRPIHGFGIVVPAIERRRILAISVSSLKFPGRAPPGKLLLRVFLGGALQPELLAQPDAAMEQIALEELQALLGLSGRPLFTQVLRWEGKMPQYHVGHCQRVQAIAQRVARFEAFALAGNALEGVGIPFCIRSGQAAAQRVWESVGAAPALRP
jgi:oxygen-dependent protoporphyrinogen oxidase